MSVVKNQFLEMINQFDDIQISKLLSFAEKIKKESLPLYHESLTKEDIEAIEKAEKELEQGIYFTTKDILGNEDN